MSRPRNNSEKFQEWLEELVEDTKAWIESIGATKDGGTVFTVIEWAQVHGYLSDDGTPNAEVWALVKDALLKQGYPLAQAFMRGHFRGDPGDQYTVLTTGFHQLRGRSKRLREQSDYFAALPESKRIFENLQGEVGETAAKTMLMAIRQIEATLGPVQQALMSWERFFLEDGANNAGDD